MREKEKSIRGNARFGGALQGGTRSRRAALFLLPVFVCFFCMTGISLFWLHAYREASFAHVSGFCAAIIEDSPRMEAQVISALKRYCESGASVDVDILSRYGYDGSGFDSAVWQKGGALLAAALLAAAGAFFISGLFLFRDSKRRIDGLTQELARINTGAAQTVLQAQEDRFSRLEDEICKTVTSLYRARENAVKAKENFADNLANIAHQLKTPITAAALSLQLVEQEALEGTEEAVKGAKDCAAGAQERCVKQKEARWKKHLRQIRHQLMRLSSLEEALLTLSRIDAGTLKLERTEVDAYTVLSLAAENLEALLQKRKLSVEIPEGEAVTFCGDLEWSMEAVMNLMKNCMEHSAQGMTIHCRYSQNPLYAELLIWDEGDGFAPEDMPRLFERFYRGKGAMGDGIGIGLSMARSIFELQNGSVTARNLPQGGACFEVRVYSRGI